MTAEPLNEADIVYFRQLLLERRAEILGEAERTAQGMGEEAETYADPTDRGVMEAERNRTLRIRDRERKLLSKIDAAIARLEAGTFGVCDECSDPIGAERLRARPVTTLCIACKAAEEEAERRAG
jgi:RNA polymerase-binding transcription factor